MEDWLGTESAPPSFEIEGLLRLLLADQGSIKDLRAALETTARQACELRDSAAALGDELLDTGGPFPQRLHLTERAAALYGEFLLLLIRWCDETLGEVETWPETRDIGLTPSARERLTQLLARARQNP